MEDDSTLNPHDCPGLRNCPACFKEAWELEHGDTPILYVRFPQEDTTAAEHRRNAADTARQVWNPIDPESHALAIDIFLGMMALHPETRHLYKDGTAALRLFEALAAEPDPMQLSTVLENAMNDELFEPPVPEPDE